LLTGETTGTSSDLVRGRGECLEDAGEGRGRNVVTKGEEGGKWGGERESGFPVDGGRTFGDESR
jgi:hypothetical protein